MLVRLKGAFQTHNKHDCVYHSIHGSRKVPKDAELSIMPLERRPKIKEHLDLERLIECDQANLDFGTQNNNNNNKNLNIKKTFLKFLLFLYFKTFFYTLHPGAALAIHVANNVARYSDNPGAFINLTSLQCTMHKI